MTEDLFLTKAELFQLTGYRWKSKQIAALKAQRIKHTVNRFDEPLVVRAHLTGGVGSQKRNKAPTEPNLAAIGG